VSADLQQLWRREECHTDGVVLYRIHDRARIDYQRVYSPALG
jgi:hypothetical protein